MTLNLKSMALAANLDSEARDALYALLQVHARTRQRNRRLDAYYESDVAAERIGVDTIPPTVNLKEACSWPKKAVRAVSERSRFDGFVFESGKPDEGLARVVVQNDLVGVFNRHVPSELTHGCMFATVGRSGEKTIVRFHTAESSAATWDAAENRIAAGFVVADARRTEWSRNVPVPVQVNLHLPGRVVVLRRLGVDRWAAESLATPLDRPMMEPFAFRATGVKPFGESRISKTVISLTQDALRTLTYMSVSAAFYAHPKEYALNLTSDQYEAMVDDKWKYVMGAMMIAEADENVDRPIEYGQLPATSPQPYIDMLMAYAKMFSGETGVPVNSLGVIQDNPSSAEAIQAAREDVCLAASDLIEGSATSLRNVALMAMAVECGCTIGDLTDDQLSVMAHFKNPSMPSIVSQADAAMKIAEADSGFAGTEVFYEMLGFSRADIARIRAEKQRAEARRRIAELMAPAGGDGERQGVSEPKKEMADVPEAQGKALNGAQTQSLLAIMSQYAGGSLTEGQAVSLIAASIGVSKADARDILNGKVD